jgi:cytochrome c556
MKQLSGKVSLVVTFLLPLLASCGQGSGPAPAAVDDSPEGQAWEYRKGVMHAVSWKVGQLRGMAQGDIPVNDMAALEGARDVAALAAMMPEGFIPNSAVPGSGALPEIWTNFADFEQKANDLQTAATALADATAANGFEASKGMVQAVGQSCGGCHRPYRRREE